MDLHWYVEHEQGEILPTQKQKKKSLFQVCISEFKHLGGPQKDLGEREPERHRSTWEDRSRVGGGNFGSLCQQ